MEIIRQILARNLKRLRGKSTQAQVASDCGIEIPTYNRWEKEKAWPDPESIEILAKYFKVDPSEFYRPVNGEYAPPFPKEEKVSLSIKKMIAVPDFVYDKAIKFPSDHMVWKMIEGAFQRFEVDVENNGSKQA